jgi:hypothetical protein
MTEHGADFLFVIDTNQYAGNFEREMCAFLTGHVGECEVGDEMAERHRKEMGNAGDSLFSNVVSVSDDRGCSRPATIWRNPRYANDGHGGHYLIEGADQKSLCARYAKAQEDYFQPLIRQKNRIIKDLEDGKPMRNWTIAGAKREIKEHEKRISEARSLTKVASYPAYLSVGIWFDTKPSEHQVELLKKRAALFPKVYQDFNKRYGEQDSIKIESFRLIEFNKTSSEQNL